MQLIILSKYKILSLEIDDYCSLEVDEYHIRDVELIFDELMELARDRNIFIVKNDEQAKYILTKNNLLKYKYKLNIEKV